MNARHTTVTAAWRQVFVEAGGAVPDRNVERLLRDTHVPVPPQDQRRLDLIVPNLNVAFGVPLFCDITIISPVTRIGTARGGTSNAGGALLRRAEIDNNRTYAPVIRSGLGALFCLGHEVYGRWHVKCVELLIQLAREHSRGLPVRLRKGLFISYVKRWSSLIGVAIQKAVADNILNSAGVDLSSSMLEVAPSLSGLHLN